MLKIKKYQVLKAAAFAKAVMRPILNQIEREYSAAAQKIYDKVKDQITISDHGEVLISRKQAAEWSAEVCREQKIKDQVERDLEAAQVPA